MLQQCKSCSGEKFQFEKVNCYTVVNKMLDAVNNPIFNWPRSLYKQCHISRGGDSWKSWIVSWDRGSTARARQGTSTSKRSITQEKTSAVSTTNAHWHLLQRLDEEGAEGSAMYCSTHAPTRGLCDDSQWLPWGTDCGSHVLFFLKEAGSLFPNKKC